MRITAMAALCAACAMSAGAQPIYKCSAAGATTYSDFPCPSGNVTSVELSRGPSPEAQAAARDRLRREVGEQNQRDAMYVASLRQEAIDRAMAMVVTDRRSTGDYPESMQDGIFVYGAPTVRSRSMRQPRNGDPAKFARSRPIRRVPGTGAVAVPREPPPG